MTKILDLDREAEKPTQELDVVRVPIQRALLEKWRKIELWWQVSKALEANSFNKKGKDRS